MESIYTQLILEERKEGVETLDLHLWMCFLAIKYKVFSFIFSLTNTTKKPSSFNQFNGGNIWINSLCHCFFFRSTRPSSPSTSWRSRGTSCSVSPEIPRATSRTGSNPRAETLRFDAAFLYSSAVVPSRDLKSHWNDWLPFVRDMIWRWNAGGSFLSVKQWNYFWNHSFTPPIRAWAHQ